MGDIYGYARCSTNESKQDINRQKRELMKNGVPEENIYWEYEHGTKDDRIELTRMFEKVKAGDAIVTTEVSRLARSTQKLCSIIKDIQEKQLKLVICNSIVFDCTPGHTTDVMTKGMIQMWGVFSEMEADMIRQRIKSGLENAKAKGKKVGRPETTKENIPPVFFKYYSLYKDKTITISDFARLAEISRATIYRYIDIVERKKKEG